MTDADARPSNWAPDPVLAWHFVGASLRDGRPVPADGVELRHDGPVVMCDSGLHASIRAIDALRYAPGPHAHRVEMRDVVETLPDKLVGRSRTSIWHVDATDVLREFARDCALDVLHLWATPRTPHIDIVVEYLLTGDESLRAAAHAAQAAARADARYAARADARYTAWAAAQAAARDTARDTAWAAAWDTAWDTAWAAARDALNDRLERMLTAANERGGE